jgi:hypothetical protein
VPSTGHVRRCSGRRLVSAATLRRLSGDDPSKSHPWGFVTRRSQWQTQRHETESASAELSARCSNYSFERTGEASSAKIMRAVAGRSTLALEHRIVMPTTFRSERGEVRTLRFRVARAGLGQFNPRGVPAVDLVVAGSWVLRAPLCVNPVRLPRHQVPRGLRCAEVAPTQCHPHATSGGVRAGAWSRPRRCLVSQARSHRNVPLGASLHAAANGRLSAMRLSRLRLRSARGALTTRSSGPGRHQVPRSCVRRPAAQLWR